MQTTKTQQVYLITLSVNHFLSEKLALLLKDHCMPYVICQNARYSLLKPRFILPSNSLSNEMLVLYRFYIKTGDELTILQDIIQNLELYSPGNGSIYSQEISLLSHESFNYNYQSQDEDTNNNLQQGLLHNMQVINCIVGRGGAEKIVQNLLEQGYLSPVVTYGMGLGLRSHLGLVRIAIPADKEIFTLIVHEKDAHSVSNYIRRVGQFYLPGKGFIFCHSIRFAKLNTRTRNSKLHHLASMDQIINAIDELKGHSEWRRKSPNNHKHLSLGQFFKKREQIGESLLLNFITNEDDLSVISNLALTLGSTGATSSRYRKLIYTQDSLTSEEKISMTMIFDKEKTHKLILLLENDGYFKRGGLLEYQDVWIP